MFSVSPGLLQALQLALIAAAPPTQLRAAVDLAQGEAEAQVEVPLHAEIPKALRRSPQNHAKP